ncbi:MAG: AAA family ATPase [Deltaproteobacteria bacterium]|nr:AAA family ATPase [Deltaproteobacteria bacterium]
MKEKKGSLTDTSLPKLLHLIYRQADPAGILDIIQEPVKKRFYFKDGMPVAAMSNILNEVLGRLLMQEGVITQKDYEGSLEIVLKEKKKHGEVLISMGLLTHERLDGFLTLQLKRRLWGIFGWGTGTYRYAKTETIPPGMSLPPLNPAELILDGISLGFYPIPSIKADLKDYLDRPVEAVPGAGRYRIADFHPTIQEERFFDSFDGVKTLREALEGSDLLRQRALALSLAFIITGLVRKRGEEEAPAFEETEAPEVKPSGGVAAPLDSRLNAELLFMKAKTALSNKEFGNAIAALKEITDLNPMEAEYWAYLGWAIFQSGPGRAAEAERIIKDAIELNNDLDAAWVFLGYIALSRGDEAEAERAFSVAFSKNPLQLEAMVEKKRLLVKREAITLHQDERKTYMDWFGFAEDPFTPSPAAKFLSLSNGQSRTLDASVKAVRRRTGPLLIEGAYGAGKTTLALELAARLKNQKILSALILSPPKNEIELIKEINSDIGGVSESPSIKEQLLTLGMRVSLNKTQNGHTVIIIDNAHALLPGCLKLIQYVARLKSLQIILLGEPALSERLKHADFTELGQKLSAGLALAPLTMEETRAYILRRISVAEKKPSAGMRAFLLSDEELKEVFEKTGGLPGLINEEAAVLLARSVVKEAPSELIMDAEIAREEPPPDKTDEAFYYEEPSFAPEEEFKGTEAEIVEEGVSGPVAAEPVKAEAASPIKEPVKAEAAPASGKKGPDIAGRAAFAEPLKPVKAQAGASAASGSAGPAAKPSSPLPKEKKPGVALRLLLWALTVLVIGLIIGSIAGLFSFSRNTGGTNGSQTVNKPRKEKTVEKAIEGSIDKALPGTTAEGTDNGLKRKEE